MIVAIYLLLEFGITISTCTPTIPIILLEYITEVIELGPIKYMMLYLKDKLEYKMVLEGKNHFLLKVNELKQNSAFSNLRRIYLRMLFLKIKTQKQNPFV